MKLLLYFILITIFLVCLLSVACYIWIARYARSKCISNINNLPEKEYGLILGTAKWVQPQKMNLYFKYRIMAAWELYKKQKVKRFIVSGAYINKKENEPADMREDLIRKGVPAENIEMDLSGFRTLDSMVHGKAIAGKNNIIIISQRFHNERAVFIGLKTGMEIIAFNAHDVKGFTYIRMQVRESLSRVKCILDLYLLYNKLRF